MNSEIKVLTSIMPRFSAYFVVVVILVLDRMRKLASKYARILRFRTR